MIELGNLKFRMKILILNNVSVKLVAKSKAQNIECEKFVEKDRQCVDEKTCGFVLIINRVYIRAEIK